MGKKVPTRMKQTINNPSRPWNRISLLTVISLLILSLSWTDSPMELTPVSADSHGVFSPDWSANPPNGRTGAPGDGLCSDCHIQTGPPQDGSVAITGFPGTIIPNQVYTLTVTVANPNGLAVRGGFQMVVLNSGDTNAGSMANGSASSTVTISGGRTYHEHNPALFFGAGTEVIYSVDWTAPSGPNAELITAYAAGNVVNGNGSNTGDLVVTTNISGTIAGSALNVVVLTSDETCFGENDGIAAAEVSGGTPGYTYSWSNGATTATINDLSPGTYCVTVTDDDGNTAENCADVGGPSPVVGSLVETSDPSCAGSADGMVEVTASGGIPGYTYMWSNGDSGATINGLTAGTYTVTITDAAGCTDVLFAVVTDPAPITILLVDLVDPACFGESSGEITVATAGGTGIVTLEWSTGDIGPSIDGLPAGDYSVVATDENGCVDTQHNIKLR